MNLPQFIVEALERHGVQPSAELRADLETLWSGHKGIGVRSLPRHTWREEAQGTLPEEINPESLPSRYYPLDTLGSGGMGVVISVYDRLLGRLVAMKIAHRDLSNASRSRFMAEAQVVAQLQHPNIVPVYDLGELPSREPYFTMAIVSGRTLGGLIREVHQTAPGWQPTASGLSIKRLLWSFQQVCDAIGYAHVRGVVHRDLKPDNMIVGEHGETVVVDWGLAKVLDQKEPELEPVFTNRMSQSTSTTMVGAVIGTMGYMPPEQANGDLARVDRRADVHALGATLYEILCDAPPYLSHPLLDRLDGLISLFETPTLSFTTPHTVPIELQDLVYACLQRDPDRRPSDATQVARTISAWLEGAHRQEKALAEVDAADQCLHEIARLKTESESLQTRARRLLSMLPSGAQAEAKYEGWQMQVRAQRAADEADLLEIRRVEALSAALRTDPNSVEAHQRLATHFRERHARAEQSADHRQAAELLQRLRTHDIHGAHQAYLSGLGTVSIQSDPPCAKITVSRYEESHYQLVAIPFSKLGHTPLQDAPLPMGSYQFTLAFEGHATVIYPIYIGRCGRWTGHRPDTTRVIPIILPKLTELGPDDRYVPPGDFIAGGDPLAEWPRPEERRWVDGFIIRRFPITNREFIAFLNDLVACGREEEALRYQPRFGADAVYGRDTSGRFVLQPDSDGDMWLPDMPAVLIDWPTAAAYAQWEAQRTGLPWRLPWELEWEKAARGTDGRHFPWGSRFDASWCAMRDSLERPMPQVVGSFPTDESPYGVRGCAGNIHEWCLDPFRKEGPLIESSAPAEPSASDERTLRGGSWHSGERWARVTSRGVVPAHAREAVLGFRLVRSYPS